MYDIHFVDRTYNHIIPPLGGRGLHGKPAQFKANSKLGGSMESKKDVGSKNDANLVKATLYVTSIMID